MEESPMNNQVTTLSREVIKSHPLLGLFFGDSPHESSMIDGLADDPLSNELTGDLVNDLAETATSSMDSEYAMGHPYHTSTDVSSESTAIESDTYLGPVVKTEDDGDLKIPSVDDVEDSFESNFEHPSPNENMNNANFEDSIADTTVPIAGINYEAQVASNCHPVTVKVVEEENQVPDTLDLLLNTPLARTNDDFARKYPEKIEMTPPSDEPIVNPAMNDILFGRGGLTNHHPGNKRYRQIVNDHKLDYIHAAKMTKPRVARRIVHALRHANNPARFLRKSSKGGFWHDVGDKVASEKTSQALREKSPEERRAAAERKRAKKAAVLFEERANEDANNYTLMYAGNINSLSDDTDIILGEIDGKVEAQIASKFSPIQENGTYHSIDINSGDNFSHYSYPVEGGIFGTVNVDGHIQITNNDVLCGRGGAVNNHQGNISFRELAASNRAVYHAASKHERLKVAYQMVQAIRSTIPPGRFLKKGADGHWSDIGDVKASEKASQVMKDKGHSSNSVAKPVSLAATNICMPVVSSIDAMQLKHEDYLCAPPIPPLPYAALGGQPIPTEQFMPTVVSRIEDDNVTSNKRPAENALDSPDASRYKFDDIIESVDV